MQLQINHKKKSNPWVALLLNILFSDVLILQFGTQKFAVQTSNVR